MTRDLDLTALRRRIRRHRRGLSATAAFLAVLLLGLGLRPSAEPTGDGIPPVPQGVVEMPVVLADAAVAGSLAPGDVVDVVAAGPSPAVIAAGAIVVTPIAGGGLTSTSTAVVLALPRASGLAIAGTQAPLTDLRRIE